MAFYSGYFSGKCDFSLEIYGIIGTIFGLVQVSWMYQRCIGEVLKM